MRIEDRDTTEDRRQEAERRRASRAASIAFAQAADEGRTARRREPACETFGRAADEHCECVELRAQVPAGATSTATRDSYTFEEALLAHSVEPVVSSS